MKEVLYLVETNEGHKLLMTFDQLDTNKIKSMRRITKWEDLRDIKLKLLGII